MQHEGSRQALSEADKNQIAEYKRHTLRYMRNAWRRNDLSAWWAIYTFLKYFIGEEGAAHE